MKRIWQRILVIAVVLGGVLAWLFAPGRSAGEAGELPQETIPTDTSEPQGLHFPFTLASGLVVEEMVSYTGTFYEDGSDEPVRDVAALMLYNPQEKTVRFGAVALEQEGKQLYFFAYCLPPGGRCLILEKQRSAYRESSVTDCRELSIRWQRYDLQSEQVRYVGFGENLTVVNHSPQRRSITVWYKHYDHEKACYLGGVAYSAYYFMVAPQEQRGLTPSHYHAGSSKVVAVE
ncbi:MAG: hypothetical protein E7470_04905 [Ruminococcaceae bacterium]|nr:hypothetical protein [Oscillospiraceae bacterium]